MRTWMHTLARLLTGALILLLTSAPAYAETVLVRAGRLIDVVEGRVLSDQIVRIEDGRIVSVGHFPAQPPAGAQIIDWSAYTVLPGLMDMHTHLVGDIQLNYGDSALYGRAIALPKRRSAAQEN